MAFVFLRVSRRSNKTHKVLRPFTVLNVRGLQAFQAVERAVVLTVEDEVIGRLLLSATYAFSVSSMLQRYRFISKRPTPVLSLLSATQRLRQALSQAGGKRQG